MTVKEFLALPKRLKYPRQRIRDEIDRLKQEIAVEPSGDVMPEEKRCCGKLTFKTREEAMAAIIGGKKKSQKPYRSYQCSAGNWHLSGQPKKKMQAEVQYLGNFN